jgi:Zn-dependent M28 family amino/carboxypeptidase
VVAILPGRDPALRDEYVLLSAHMDHVGVGRPMNGDSIYNGADDNASGTSGLLEIARVLSSLPERPRRSVVFLWVSGEEKGLLGSRWFADNPTFPIERVVANINADMIGSDRHRDSVVVIGKDYSTLGEVVNRVNARHPELRLTASDDIWPEQQFFYRSDHVNFLRKEIPALFFFTGVHECYHQPCDTPDFVDAGKAARVATLILHTVTDIANAERRPEWDPAGLEEVRRLTR